MPTEPAEHKYPSQVIPALMNMRSFYIEFCWERERERESVCVCVCAHIVSCEEQEDLRQRKVKNLGGLFPPG